MKPPPKKPAIKVEDDVSKTLSPRTAIPTHIHTHLSPNPIPPLPPPLLCRMMIFLMTDAEVGSKRKQTDSTLAPSTPAPLSSSSSHQPAHKAARGGGAGEARIAKNAPIGVSGTAFHGGVGGYGVGKKIVSMGMRTTDVLYGMAPARHIAPARASLAKDPHTLPPTEMLATTGRDRWGRVIALQARGGREEAGGRGKGFLVLSITSPLPLSLLSK